MSWLTRFFNLERATAPAALKRSDLPWWPESGEYVNDDSALQVSAVWSAVRLIAESVAGLPWQVYERSGGRRELLSQHSTTNLLNRMPNSEMTAFDARAMLMTSVLLRGNAYAEIERDLRGQPIALWPIAPDRVQVRRDEIGRIVYLVDRRALVDAADMYHLKGLSLDGLTGLSVIAQARYSIATGLSSDKFASGFFKNGTHVGAILKVPGVLKADGRDNLENSLKKYRGAGNRGKALILEQGIDYQAIGMPPEDAQFVEQRRFNVSEIARWFRVPPHKIGDLEKATFSNIEQQAREFVDDALLPWCARLEQEADRKLLGAKQRGRLFTRLNLRGLLRGDSQAQAAFFQTMFNLGVYSQNDILALLDENGIGAVGDKRYIQLNLQTLERAASDMQPEPASTPEPDDGLAARVFSEVFDRLQRREAGRVEQAPSAEWITDVFGPGHRDYAIKALSRAAEVVFSLPVSADVIAVVAESETQAAVARALDVLAGETPVTTDPAAVGQACLETLRNAIKVPS